MTTEFRFGKFADDSRLTAPLVWAPAQRHSQRDTSANGQASEFHGFGHAPPQLDARPKVFTRPP